MSENERFWEIFEYEVQMYWGMIKIREALGGGEKIKLGSLGFDPTRLAINAFIESKLLHMRIISDALLEHKGGADDLLLSDFLPEWKDDKKLVLLLKQLESVFGKAGKENSPRWIINKMAAHPTKLRGASYDYQSVFTVVDPVLLECIRRLAEIKKRDTILQLINSVI